jgi:hypothetical protein
MVPTPNSTYVAGPLAPKASARSHARLPVSLTIVVATIIAPRDYPGLASSSSITAVLLLITLLAAAGRALFAPGYTSERGHSTPEHA